LKKHISKFITTTVFTTAFIIHSASADIKPNSDKQYAANSDIVEVAFVLDTTGSMADLIAGAKQKIWSIANTIVDINPNADIRMALVAYRDVGDDYVIKPYEMSSDIQGMYGNLIGLQADGGGDTPESVNEALDTAVDDLKWTKGANVRRIVFLVGDAPPHMDYQNGPKYPAILHQAVQKDIEVHAIQAGDSNATKTIWKDIALRGGGSYIPIPQDGGQISEVQTPFDDEIINLQQRLDKTVVPYGAQETQAALEQKILDKASGSVSKRVDNSAFYSKRKSRKEVVTGGGDIISAVRNNDVELESVEQENLPVPMQSMSIEEQKSYVDGIIKERAKIEEEMYDLVQKRDEFIKSSETKAESTEELSFDKAVRNAL
jgi:hypothetical protein